MSLNSVGGLYEGILPVLYDLALVIGNEISLKPLLTRTLQRLLYYTSFPAGFVCLGVTESTDGLWVDARIDAAVGDYHLVDLIGKRSRLPAALLEPGARAAADEAELLGQLPIPDSPYTSFLRLPIEGQGYVVLLAPHQPPSKLPLTKVFEPIMAHLAKAVVLCRNFDAYTSGLIAERDQLANQQWLAAKMFESSYSAIMITDPAGTILSVNEAFSRITGYRSEEVVGRNPNILASGRHDREFFRHLWHEILTNDQWVGEVWNRRQNGEIFPGWMLVSAVRDRAGKLTNLIGFFTDISEQKAAEAHVEYLSNYDPLTGLPNRVLLRDRVEHAIAASIRDQKKVALLYIDIDNFKIINDTLGHTLGDEFLKAVAQRLRTCLRDADTVCRQGADEFLVLLANIDDSGGAALAAGKILAGLKESLVVDDQRFNISATIGISLSPDDGNDFGSLLRSADTALRSGKEHEPGGYRFFTDAMNVETKERFAMELCLHGALERGEFTLHYQPQIDFGTGKIIGAEALIRWNNPKMGSVSPARFIPVAEKSGAIVPIGAWVVAEACRQVAEWRTAGLMLKTIAVNFSAIQFIRGQVFQTVHRALAESGLAPACLEIEITESVLVHDSDQTQSTMRALKALGVRLSLDDFGTGYSSLAYLTRFAVDKLKVDQSFVREMITGSDASKIVRTIILLGHNLGLETVAEGVETEAQARILYGYGCNSAQGYYYGRPMPAQDFARLLDAESRAVMTKT